MKILNTGIFALIAIVGVACAAETPRTAQREYDILRSFPAGRLAALSANDGPNAQGFTGSNRVTGPSAGAQRGNCRAVMVSIFFGQVLALHVPVPEFEAALPAAIAWQLTRILPGGEVDVRGNTRTGVGKEKSPFDGKTKNVNYPEVIFALTYYGLVHHDEAALAAAERVFSYHQRTHSRGA